MKVVTSNIRDNPDLPRPAVRLAAAETARLGGVALFQEIGEREDHIDIEDAMGRDWTWSHHRLPIPIAVKTKYWEIVEQGFELTHHGKAGVSPNRYIAWIVVRRKARTAALTKKRRLLCIMNTHFVSGAFNPHKDEREWRQARWAEHWKIMQAKIASFIARGISVLFGGDFNRTHVQPFMAQQKWLVQHGIDKIGFIQATGGIRVVKVWKSGHNDTKSDHDAAWANVVTA